MSAVLPNEFKYDSKLKTLDVTWGDGSIVRYFDVSPTLAFLDPMNSRRNRDFLEYLEYEYVPWGEKFVKVKRRVPVKSEVVQKATTELNQPVTRPLLAYQQSGYHTS